MQRAFLTLILSLLTLASHAGVERPKGFLGINWGASPEEAKRVMQGRPGVKFPEETDDYKFELTGGEFAGQPVAKWILEFPERKFASATVVLKTEGNAQAMYKEFRTQLVSKYGSATTDRKLSNRSPRSNQGGERQTMFGNMTQWRFIPNLKEKSTIVIAAELAGPNGQATQSPEQLQLTLRYVNETLTGSAAANAAAGAAATKTGVKKDDL